MPRYAPANSLESPRFTGVRTFMRLPFAQTTADVDFAVVGLPFDTGATWRVGTRFGPEAIRSQSSILRPYHLPLDVNIFDHLSGVDYGDAAVVPGFIEHSYERITEFVAPLHAAGVTPIGLGGDHSIVLAELRAAARQHGPLGLVQFDAHGDVWDSYFGHKYTHGTPIRRAVEEGLLDGSRVIQVGMRGPLYEPHDIEQARDFGFDVLTADDVRALGIPKVCEAIRRKVGSGPTFLSFDIDFFDPAYAPGTGTPEVGGFTSAEGQQLLRGLAGGYGTPAGGSPSDFHTAARATGGREPAGGSPSDCHTPSGRGGAAAARATGGSEPAGGSPSDFHTAARATGGREPAGINFVAFDVVEVLPAYDNAGGITVLLGANVAWEMIALLAWRKKRNS